MDNADEQSYSTLIYSKKKKRLWQTILNESDRYTAPPFSPSASLNVFHHYIYKKCRKFKHTVWDSNVWQV